MNELETPPSDRRRRILRWVLLAVLVATAAAGLAVDPEAAFREIHRQRFALLDWVGQNRLLAVGLYMGVYVVGVALSLPGAVWMTILGGFVFGTVAGTFYTVIAATIGATAVFLAAKFIMGDALRRRVGGFLGRLEQGFRRHAFNYLIVLRMLPLFPFWVVNLVPALVGMPLRVYVLGTLIGIIPGSLVFASLGAGLSEVLDRQTPPDISVLATPELLLPLLGLSLLALAPVAWAHWRQRRSDADA